MGIRGIQNIKGSRPVRYLTDLMRIIGEKRIDTYSAGTAFYIFMSFIPYSLILLSTVKYLPFSKEDLLAFADSVLPMDLGGLMVYIIDELYRNGIGILSISVIAAIWASAKGIFGITKGLNEIVDAKDVQNFIKVRIKSMICTLLLMLGMILLLVISVFGNTITSIVKRYVDIPGNISNLLEARDLIMFFVLTALFLFFFCALPAKKIKVSEQLPGAAFASFVWIMFTKLFSLYLSSFHGYSMYGSFAVVLVIGIWLYTGMYIMFMGALINELRASRKGKDNER